MQIAVGGCLAQKDRATITRKAPWVDVVFGTHNIGSLPALLERAGCRRRRRSRSSSRSRSSRRRCRRGVSRRTPRGSRCRSGATTPARSASCPACAARRRTAGPATSSPRSARWSARASCEVTLLGQNVNAYGVEFGDRQAFSKLLRACGEIDGLERVRFTSPHPAEFTDDVIDAMAETPNVMHQLHMPLQSGSDRRAARDAAVLPAREVPRHHRAGPRSHAGRRGFRHTIMRADMTDGAAGPVIAVIGATAAGKSALAVRLALALGGEVVNADSMQLYRGMDIGTAKLTPAERGGVPHHLLDIWDIRQTASVAEYQRIARGAVDEILARGRVPVLVGGSGLYVRAVLDHLEFPPATRWYASGWRMSLPSGVLPHCTTG